jgi:hypothetical protein
MAVGQVGFKDQRKVSERDRIEFSEFSLLMVT